MARITGRKAHSDRIKRVSGPAMIREVGKAVHAAADYLKVEAQVSITAGAVSGKGHVPSAPGSAPNNDTGHLADNIVNQPTGPLKAEVASNAAYSVELELGTSKMSARPFMGPAAAKTRPQAQKLVQAAVKRVVGGGTV